MSKAIRSEILIPSSYAAPPPIASMSRAKPKMETARKSAWAQPTRRHRLVLRTAIQSLCFLLAGATEDQRDAGTIWLAFVSKASTSAEIAAAHRKAWSAMEEALDGLLRAIAPHADRDDAAGLLATLDDLAIARVTEPTRMRSLSDFERRPVADDSE
ncbi:TetR family transcriptional regulator C-terminal domain-containing protein [Microbacterium sp. A196]|uniref:TetR family transcriptional regulator C-terminal domain-containing protein n=1 Tax=Microbacterium sp. A196 TaxID=3457320 RepID=UPI003FD2D476